MTMHPYYKNGHPVYRNGKPYWCDYCPCICNCNYNVDTIFTLSEPLTLTTVSGCPSSSDETYTFTGAYTKLGCRGLIFSTTLPSGHTASIDINYIGIRFALHNHEVFYKSSNNCVLGLYNFYYKINAVGINDPDYHVAACLSYTSGVVITVEQ